MPEVCVPFRTDNGHRSDAWNLLEGRWMESGFRVHRSDSDPGEPFNAAVARNRAIEKAAGPVILVCDADIRIPIRVAHEAIFETEITGLYTVAHNRICWLNEKRTRRVLAGKKPKRKWGDEEAQHTWSACYAVPLELWRQVGGYDERFQGWGYQDIAFWMACHTLGPGSNRVEGTAFHLYHPPRHLPGQNPYLDANQALFERYKQAYGDATEMRALCLEHEAI